MANYISMLNKVSYVLWNMENLLLEDIVLKLQPTGFNENYNLQQN